VKIRYINFILFKISFTSVFFSSFSIFPVKIVVLDGNCAVDCGPGTEYTGIHMFQYAIERRDAITKNFVESITLFLA